MQITQNQFLALSLLFLTLFLYTSNYNLCFICLAGIGAVISILYDLLFVSSKLNQWLLILRNGKLIRGGIGTVAPRFITDNVIRFQTCLEQIPITLACQTKQRQRIKIFAEVFFSCSQSKEGAYKYYQNIKKKQRVNRICEDFLRQYSVKNSLKTIFQNEAMLRKQLKMQKEKQFGEIGIHLQNICFKQIKILDQELFQNLQARYRLDAQNMILRIKKKIERQFHQFKEEEEKQLKQQTISEKSLRKEELRKEYIGRQSNYKIKKINLEKSTEAIIEEEIAIRKHNTKQ